MIPLRYRLQLPPYWYENEVAEMHFVGAGGETDEQQKKSTDIQNQFLLPLATWGLDMWDWIYFGYIQAGSYDERRENIRRKNLSKARFTIPTLQAIGKQAGALERVSEDFSSKEIIFEFSTDRMVQLNQLSNNFNRIRPVHVSGHQAVVITKTSQLALKVVTRFFEVDYPICGEFYAHDDIDGYISRERIKVSGSARTFTMDYPVTNNFYPATE